MAASANGDLSQNAHFDLGLSYSRTEGNYNLPGCTSSGYSSASAGLADPIAALAWRRITRPLLGCGSAHSTAKWRVRATASYYNPFGNAIEFADQYGAEFASQANP